MKVLLVGAGGQLGRALQLSCPNGMELSARTRAELDLSDPTAAARHIGAERPDVVVNAAAYTAVDRAEREPGLAYEVNATGAQVLAQAAADCGARLIHVSTDFVFDGTRGRPYRVDDATSPIGVYGASKLAGEQAVRRILGEEALVLRTAWVYSSRGQNFVKTMLRVMSQRDSVRVVADQIGTPTWARGLARALWRGIELGVSGTHHWTDAGVASWYDFAVAIQEEALTLGLLARAVPIEPIPTAEYPTPAKRPAYSVLDKTETWAALGEQAPHWRASLRGMLGEVAEGVRSQD